jgi:penicillin-binding protein 2
VANVEERHFLPIYQGMVGVTTHIGESYGTARNDFLGYDVKVAAKTGTVQFDDALGNNAVFIAYAPADNPEIAVAIVIEKGGAGSSIASVAKTIFDYYFASTRGVGTVDGDGVLLK